VDLHAVLRSLSEGPLEPVFRRLLNQHAAPRQPAGDAPHSAAGDDDAEDGDEEEDEDAIEGTFQNLALSLRRPKEPRSSSSHNGGESKRDPATPAKPRAVGAARGSAREAALASESCRGEAKGGDSGDQAEAVASDDDSDFDDSDGNEVGSGDEYASDLSEFEAEPPLESPALKGRPPVFA
jgi:hypothetical protein